MEKEIGWGGKAWRGRAWGVWGFGWGWCPGRVLCQGPREGGGWREGGRREGGTEEGTEVGVYGVKEGEVVKEGRGEGRQTEGWGEGGRDGRRERGMESGREIESGGTERGREEGSEVPTPFSRPSDCRSRIYA